MNVNDEDLYEKHQILSALGGVLLHDLRNPLHSATLLVEAMSLRPSDLDTLRARLRGQLAKLDALISDASGPMREFALEPRMSVVAPSTLLGDAMALVRTQTEGLESRIEMVHDASAGGAHVQVDAALVARALFEVIQYVGGRVLETEGSRARVTVGTNGDATTLSVTVGGSHAPLPETVAKAPFAISGGGVGLALARALVQACGASLRLQDGAGPRPRFVFGLPLAGPDAAP